MLQVFFIACGELVHHNHYFMTTRGVSKPMAQLEHIEAIEKRLWNAADTLTDFQQHYEKIVSEYNHEKNRVVIEKTFEDLFNLYQDLNEEEERAMREGLCKTWPYLTS